MNVTDLHHTTPLVATRGNIRTKLELFSPGGSHKARAARHVVRRAIETGAIVPGDRRRILEKSGGNFGVALAYEARKFDIGVDLVVGLSFSPLKRALCEEFGARLVGSELLYAGMQPKEAIARLMTERPDAYFFTDQFSNPANVEAHWLETGPELLCQLSVDLPRYAGCIFVTAAGTGASASAIGRRLKAGVGNVRLVLNEPASCSYRYGSFADHVQKGTAVGVAPPFLDLALIDDVMPVRDEEAREGQRLFAQDTGVYPGPSSGGNYFLARRLAERHPDYLVATLIYDSGEGYIDADHLA